MAKREPTSVVILGAAGRDFHNFNTLYRENDQYEVVAFTATQIPDIADRRYPPELSGASYPDGIPIVAEEELESLIDSAGVDLVVFSYSDVSHEHVMHLAARANAAGADFLLPGNSAALRSTKPVVSVTAVRTGAGKSQTARKIRSVTADAGVRVAAIRHPMPYGNLLLQRLQRFATFEDLSAADVTIEEREEYEPYIRDGAVVFAGADYEAILRAAEAEAELIIWDGGNNDTPFIVPDVDICVVDPHRAGHELRYWPGEANLRRATAIIINKVDTAEPGDIAALRTTIADVNPKATITEAASRVRVDDPSLIEGKRVLVVEDGPTTTHGEMAYGAGWVAAKEYGAAEIIDPRPYARGSIAEVFAKYDHLEWVLPAMGYGEAQRAHLRDTINAAASDIDTVVIGTPSELARVIDMEVPSAQVFYDLEELTGPSLRELLAPVLK